MAIYPNSINPKDNKKLVVEGLGYQADQRAGRATQGVKAKHYWSKVAIDIMAVKGFKALDFPFIDTDCHQYRKGWLNDWTGSRMKS